jgi:hypothetical protein
VPTAPDKPALPAISWAVILLVPLLLSSAHVPLWARADVSTIESGSLHFMLIVQFAVSAMLFPWLMRDLRSTCFAILLGALFIQLAAMLGGETWETTAAGMLESCIWLSSLALWKAALTNPKHQLIAVALTTAIVLGGWTAQYLALEFGSRATQSIGATPIRIGLAVNWICALIVSQLAHRKLK